MAEAWDEKGIIGQNLVDAGCCPELTGQCLALLDESDRGELLRRLRQYRSQLLDKIHTGQEQLDCLDYLIYKLEKQKAKENEHEQ